MTEIKVRLDPVSGNVSFTGPIQDKIFCLGLLEIGKQIVLEAHKQGSEKNKPNPEIINMIGKVNG
jgi:hypothetical protein